MLKVWGRANSSNVMKVLWYCAEAGIAHERIDAGMAFGVTREPRYLAMNPNAQVPTIEEPDGWSLYESNSILRYLARSHGDALYPAGLRERADVERWMDWQLATLSRPMTTIFWTFVRTPEPERDLPGAAKAAAEAARLWAMVAERVAVREFVCGPLTLADIALGVFLHRWYVLPVERPAQPALDAWYARLLARPAYAQHIAVPMS